MQRLVWQSASCRNIACEEMARSLIASMRSPCQPGRFGKNGRWEDGRAPPLLPLRLFARPLQELLEQALLLCGVVSLGRLRARLVEVDGARGCLGGGVDRSYFRSRPIVLLARAYRLRCDGERWDR